MAVPSRAFVGVVIFGLITSLSILAYIVLLLTWDGPAPDSPFEVLFPPGNDVSTGEIVFLATAALFALAFTAFAWWSLLQGARRDREARHRLAAAKRIVRQRKEKQKPPGYS